MTGIRTGEKGRSIKKSIEIYVRKRSYGDVRRKPEIRTSTSMARAVRGHDAMPARTFFGLLPLEARLLINSRWSVLK